MRTSGCVESEKAKSKSDVGIDVGQSGYRQRRQCCDISRPYADLPVNDYSVRLYASGNTVPVIGCVSLKQIKLAASSLLFLTCLDFH
jgi:hypothetical protein